MIREAQREREHLAALSRLSTPPPAPAAPVAEIPMREVEDALRNLTSLAYLGEHSLAKLSSVAARLPAQGATHLDRGRAVHYVLSEAIERLCPDGKRPRDPIPREWHPYIILHDAYLEDAPNRDIMARLYISEGTFNRTRRAALRAVTRLLEEKESAFG
jgi:hypothetical protein